MGQDEYDTGASRGAIFHSFIAPLIVLALAVLACVVGSGMSSARDLFAVLKSLAASNQILQAFIASSILGIVSYAFVLGGNTVLSWLRGRTFCSITITNKDESFDKIIDFIGKQGIVSSGCLIASTRKKEKTWKDWRSEFLMGVRKPPSIHYNPANNNDVHVIRYNGSRILMHRHKGETVVAGWERMPMQMETLTLSSFGADVSPLKALIDDAMKASFEESLDELSIFTISDMWGAGWEKALSKKPRSIESVILDENLATSLVKDARDFLDSAKWYDSVGIPFRRGYLLYGPPGCGKTSFCQALAGALRLDICMLTLSNKGLDDNSLAACLRDAPPNAIVLLEDVDAVFVDRSVQADGTGRNAGVTFSGLLNALDGVASQEGRLFFMTTNHIEKLDPALIRPGRCDVKVEVRRASRAQASKLFTRFFPEAPSSQATDFADALPEYEISMAALQGFLLEHKASPDGALAHVQKLLLTSKPLHVDRMSVFEHLRRVGLEGWAKLFAFHGYSLRADLRGLSIDTVKGWSGALRLDARACKRMELLLAENEALMNEYQLIDMATAKEMFVAVYGNAPAGFTNDEELPSAVATTPPSSSDGEGDAPAPSPPSSPSKLTELPPRSPVRVSRPATLSRLADQLCAALTRDGKAAASIWQVRHHLHLYAHSAFEAVTMAYVLVEPSPPCGADAIEIDELSTYGWLRRAGLEKHAHALEEAGYRTARELYGLQESVLKDEVGIKDALELKRLTALLNAADGNARALLGFTSPDYARLRADFLATFAATPEVAERHASEFAKALCDRSGHGLASLVQVEAYLASKKDAGAAAASSAARSELLEHTRPEQPPKEETPPPTAWVYSWLKEKGLERLAAQLIDAGFEEAEDLRLEPRLNMDDLAAIGVEKAADRRKLFNLLKNV